eukprot:TRINITY_DN6389_c0_g1_i4.p1 TRINITY_DN6389_c0_g1~~TRINITY_DN6389_c0_g1_i4.p1  ORF type:complete len:466 (+),score=62.15 TRINITY_DN6389_c0_g1_i4:99-1496(+)
MSCDGERVPLARARPLFVGDEKLAFVAPRRTMDWYEASVLVLTDVVGTSVLTLAGVARMLGWVPTIILISGAWPVSFYTGTLMVRVRNALVREDRPEPLSMAEAVRYTFKSDTAADMIYFLVYGLLGFMGNSSYLLVLGQCLQGMFPSAQLCVWKAVLISSACCLPVSAYVRHFKDSVSICVANFIFILAPLAIVITQLVRDGVKEGSQTFDVAEDLTFTSLFGACTNILYSYASHWCYFELMAEMKEPADFPKTLLVNGPVQISLYLLVAIVGYYYAGNQAEGYFLDNLARGTLSHRIASGLLFVHVVIAFLIKNVVLTRFVHCSLSPSTVEDETLLSHCQHAAFATVLIFGGFLVANAIPFFSDFLGLIGGLLNGPVSFVLPAVLFFGAMSLVGSSLQKSPERNDTAASSREDQHPSDWCSLCDSLTIALICTVTVCTMVFGTYHIIVDITVRSQASGPPFSC